MHHAHTHTHTPRVRTGVSFFATMKCSVVARSKVSLIKFVCVNLQDFLSWSSTLSSLAILARLVVEDPLRFSGADERGTGKGDALISFFPPVLDVTRSPASLDLIFSSHQVQCTPVYPAHPGF
jgi:hypothetical protein